MKQFFSLKATITCAIIAVLTLTLLQAVLLPGMDQRVSDDAKSGIPAINDPAAAAQDQYGKMAQGAGVGAGSGAALGALHALMHGVGPALCATGWHRGRCGCRACQSLGHDPPDVGLCSNNARHHKQAALALNRPLATHAWTGSWLVT